MKTDRRNILYSLSQVPLSVFQGEHTVDPVNDLIPFCPNYHRMIHKRKLPYSIDEF